jgi:hypothetical protein
MKIVGVCSFNGGEKAVKKKYAKELDEVKSVLAHVDARSHNRQTREPLLFDQQTHHIEEQKKQSVQA